MTDINEAGQTWIDRRQCHRDRPMQVLCLGPGRTGTDSMRVALKTLGFDDCYHGYAVVHENPPDCYMWQQAMDWKLDGKGEPFTKKDWDQLLGHCRAVTDLPCVLFSRELIETYPDAKVILTHPPKDFDKWYQSTCNTIVRLKDDWTRDAWGLLNHEAKMTRDTFFRSFDAFWRGDFKKHAREVFDDQMAEVRSLVPPERLLEYDVTQGWQPLAEFLEVPVPKVDFPSGNDPQKFFERFTIADGRRRRESLRTLGVCLLASVAIGAVVWRSRESFAWLMGVA